MKNADPIVVIVERDGNAIRLKTNLGDLDPCDLPHVFGALAAHLDLDHAVMSKAVRPKPGRPDPRFPELQVLIRAARRDFDRWGEQLVKAVEKLLDEGKLLPLTPYNESVLLSLFENHRLALQIRMTGHATNLNALKRLQKLGLVSTSLTSQSYVDMAWRLGRGLEMLGVIKRGKKGAPSLDSVVKEAMTYKPTKQDQEAILYARRRAAIHMQRPAQTATDSLARTLNDEQFRVIRHAVEEGTEKKWSTKRVASALSDAVQGHPSLSNDMERVARTELTHAHSHGAYVALKEQAAEEKDEPDPLVYKFVSPNACVDCRRIWGPVGDPIKYRLSEVEAREAAGGNIGLKRQDWGPVIGPVHPNCLEGPLMRYHADLMDLINEAAADFEQLR